jgi:hypothetical protein
MYGKTKRGMHYYICAPRRGYLPDGHPARGNFWIREEHILDGVTDFLAERVFGRYRADLLTIDGERLQVDHARSRAARIATLREQIVDNDDRSRRQIRSFELVEKPDPDWVRGINERRAELLAEKASLETELAALEDEVQDEANRDLLELLPVSPIDLDDLSDEVSRGLFDALRLEVRYNRDTDSARCRITLSGNTITSVAGAARLALVRGSTDTERQTNEEDRVAMPNDVDSGVPFCVVPPAGLGPAHWAAWIFARFAGTS